MGWEELLGLCIRYILDMSLANTTITTCQSRHYGLTKTLLVLPFIVESGNTEFALATDHTKQAAIMLMTGHTPKQKGRSPTQQGSGARMPTLAVGIKTPRPRGRPPKKSLSASTRSARASSTSDNNSSKGSLDISVSDFRCIFL